jgi:hypothetical protein
MLKNEYLSRQICARTNDFMTDSNDDFGGWSVGTGCLQCVLKDFSELKCPASILMITECGSGGC